MLSLEYTISKSLIEPLNIPPLEYFYDPLQYSQLKEKLKIKSNNILCTYWNKILDKTDFFKYYSLCCYKIFTIYGNNNSVIIIDD